MNIENIIQNNTPTGELPTHKNLLGKIIQISGNSNTSGQSSHTTKPQFLKRALLLGGMAFSLILVLSVITLYPQEVLTAEQILTKTQEQITKIKTSANYISTTYTIQRFDDTGEVLSSVRTQKIHSINSPDTYVEIINSEFDSHKITGMQKYENNVYSRCANCSTIEEVVILARPVQASCGTGDGEQVRITCEGVTYIQSTPYLPSNMFDLATRMSPDELSLYMANIGFIETEQDNQDSYTPTIPQNDIHSLVMDTFSTAQDSDPSKFFETFKEFDDIQMRNETIDGVEYYVLFADYQEGEKRSAIDVVVDPEIFEIKAYRIFEYKEGVDRNMVYEIKIEDISYYEDNPIVDHQDKVYSDKPITLPTVTPTVMTTPMITTTLQPTISVTNKPTPTLNSNLGRITGHIVGTPTDEPETENFIVCARGIHSLETPTCSQTLVVTPNNYTANYSLNLEEGLYYVYAINLAYPTQKIYYTGSVECGLPEKCPIIRLDVRVTPGETKTNINPVDYYNNFED